jgi:hypothetical protein
MACPFKYIVPSMLLLLLWTVAKAIYNKFKDKISYD